MDKIWKLSYYLSCILLSQLQMAACVPNHATQAQQGTLDWAIRPCLPKNISYLAGSQKVTWFQAFVICKQNNMELASITNREEETALEHYINSIPHKSGAYEGYWLAGIRHGSCNTDLIWFTTGKPLIYRQFSGGQPDNAGSNEHCLEILLDGKIFMWNDIDCQAKLGFICQSSRPLNNALSLDNACF